MAERAKLSQEVRERPLSEWSTTAVEFLGAQSHIIEGERWSHHVIEKGEGPTLLMYHGIGGHAETYARTLPQIAAAGYHVYAVDALYHGYSSKPTDFDSSKVRERQVEAVVDLIKALGLERPHFEGESMGAMIGFELALRYPQHCGKVILNGFGSVQSERPRSDFPPPLARR